MGDAVSDVAGDVADAVRRIRSHEQVRLDPVDAHQRSEPEQLRTGPVQSVDLEGKIAILVPVEAIGDQQHNAPLPQNPA